ncbi:unnamed protein product [Linum trigynum]|uniref:Protein kinase domain-containing protein n=1 Tax=Linum trigynum TaxID=586398 RepID=A0AAV2F1R5_9ROSI
MGCVNSKRAVSSAAGGESPVLNYPPASTNVLQDRLSYIDPSSRASSRNPSGILVPSVVEQKQRSGKIRNIGDLLEAKEEGEDGEGEKGKRRVDRKKQLQKVGEIQAEINYLIDTAVDNVEKKAKRKKLERRSSIGEIGEITFKSDVLQPQPSRRLVGAEQIAAGWPSWLSSAAGEAINGWVPLQADAFEKLEKIGQGTYSSVFKAREVETGRMVALKKVRFDNYQPESIRFMAREILILRRLDHPNIIKLEGIITSRLSSSIYLVFEYMEHDLAGLSSSPEINLTEPQIKCYMKQLLRAVEHCHLRGVMHRDIKMSNILVNNNGILKLADFGLANVLATSGGKQRLTSRVVTLWYRPPELLLGSTSYNVSVDLWSVGCVFAELLTGKPLLKGRTEVEQLHKIFKLCGSPPDEFWKQYHHLPNATMFRPQHPYESSLKERCKDFPPAAVDLLECLISIDPEKRGSASSALMSRFINSEPYACDPSTLPKYPPNKEMDAKYREDRRRKKSSLKPRESVLKRPKATHHRGGSLSKLILREEVKENNNQPSLTKVNANHPHAGQRRGGGIGLRRELSMESNTTVVPTRLQKGEQQQQQRQHQHQAYTGPAPAISASSGFAWTTRKRRDDLLSTLSYDTNGSQVSGLDAPFKFPNLNAERRARDVDRQSQQDCHNKEQHTISSQQQQQNQFDAPPPDSLKAFLSYVIAEDIPLSHATHDPVHQSDTIQFSGPLLSQSNKVAQSNQIGELLRKNENQIRRVARRSRLDREM